MALKLALWVTGAVCGFAIGTAVVVSRAEDEQQPAIDAETLAAAADAHVDPIDLKGASLTTGLPPRIYLLAVGELAPPKPPPDALDKLIDCLSWFESRGDPNAVNRSSGAAGPLQFLLSTWLSTPQGRAGLSRFDPVASRSAARWMLQQGRLHEWATWRYCA